MITTDCVLDLYRRYCNDLKAVRRQQYWIRLRHDNAVVRRLRKLRLRRYMLFPALHDLEAEITYLIIRDRNPHLVIEMSPNGGWSTTWILSALRDNGNGGQLWSYDIHNTSTKLVPNTLASGRWYFVQGDARQLVFGAPDFEYLFIDSDHTKEFAHWYVETLFQRARPGCLVSVHDVFHSEMPSDEGAVVMSWLKARGLSYWTAAPAANGQVMPVLMDERLRLGIDYVVNPRYTPNSMMFFEIV